MSECRLVGGKRCFVNYCGLNHCNVKNVGLRKGLRNLKRTTWRTDSWTNYKFTWGWCEQTTRCLSNMIVCVRVETTGYFNGHLTTISRNSTVCLLGYENKSKKYISELVLCPYHIVNITFLSLNLFSKTT